MSFYIIASTDWYNRTNYHAATVLEPPTDEPRKILPIYLSHEEAKLVARQHPSTKVLEIKLPPI